MESCAVPEDIWSWSAPSYLTFAETSFEGKPRIGEDTALSSQHHSYDLMMMVAVIYADGHRTLNLPSMMAFVCGVQEKR